MKDVSLHVHSHEKIFCLNTRSRVDTVLLFIVILFIGGCDNVSQNQPIKSWEEFRQTFISVYYRVNPLLSTGKDIGNNFNEMGIDVADFSPKALVKKIYRYRAAHRSLKQHIDTNLNSKQKLEYKYILSIINSGFHRKPQKK